MGTARNFVIYLSLATTCAAQAADPETQGSPEKRPNEKRPNNLVSILLEVPKTLPRRQTFSFTRPTSGWILISSASWHHGNRIVLDPEGKRDIIVMRRGNAGGRIEAMRHVEKGAHQLRVEVAPGGQLDRLVVKAIPELVHCGLGFEPAIKAFGHYDLAFLKRDVLPNVTTLIVPGNLQLPQPAIDDWHRQGKRFVAEVGVDANAKTAEDHVKNWTAPLAKSPFLDGVIVDEFIVNNPSINRSTVSAARQKRLQEERDRHRVYEEAMRKLTTDARFKGKMLYAYFGGSGKKLNQEVIGKSFVRTILDCGYRIVPERYLFEVTSEQKSKAALDAFVEGIADWQTKEPGAKKQMVIAFGLFSMPPGGINKLPNVDYHVWMDQQMNVVANNPVFAGLDGIEWWTSLLADEETVRFVGKLYRHYAIEGKTSLLTRDPLYLDHIQNADFEKGLEGWTLHAAEEKAIQARSFPRYGRIEGRYMGLGRPADPEHIGDTFLWMKRSAKGPNSFSQTIKHLEPGRLYSMEMFSCDYRDLVEPKKKSQEEAHKFLGSVQLDGVEVDSRRSFEEMYASSPEPPISVWITYHWKVFRAAGPTAELVVSDWPAGSARSEPFGQEQIFNFLEIQPYHE
ncbi:MAG TPA: hypothetical protein VFG04_25155 [Planctomycetaceae bacterium]|nr:hypothetical protein [Planctomycetaceae bacterium]